MMTNDDLEQLITQYGKDIYSFCIYLTQNTDMADDLYQEIFLVASRRRRIVSASEKPKEYLLSVAVHTWTNMKRKYARRLSIVPEISYEDAFDVQSGDDIQAQVIDAKRKEAVRLAVHKLPEKYRMVTLLHYMEEMGVTQIAKMLHVPAGTVKSRLAKARKILAGELEEWIDE